MTIYGQIKKFLSYCGGLPAPECAGNPLGYKFSYAPHLALRGPLTSACYLSDGKQVHIPENELMKHAKPYYISPAFAFHAYPNRDSLSFQEFYNIPEAETIVRGTLRYQVFPDFVRALIDLGLLDSTEKDYLTGDITFSEMTQKAIGARDSTERQVGSHPNWVRLLIHSQFPHRSNQVYLQIPRRGQQHSDHIWPSMDRTFLF